jgi:antitoxin HicB
MTRLTYSVLLQPDPDEGGYTVTVPELPGIVTQGDTFEEALAMAREAIALHVEGLAEDGLPVPVERAAPLVAQVSVEVRDLVLA